MNPLRCAWCSRVIGTTTADGGSDGICGECGIAFYTRARLWRVVIERLLAGVDVGAMVRAVAENLTSGAKSL